MRYRLYLARGSSMRYVNHTQLHTNRCTHRQTNQYTHTHTYSHPVTQKPININATLASSSSSSSCLQLTPGNQLGGNNNNNNNMCRNSSSNNNIGNNNASWQPAKTTCNWAAFNVHFILCFSYVLSLLISAYLPLPLSIYLSFTFGINLISFLVFNGRLVGFVQLPLSARRLYR